MSGRLVGVSTAVVALLAGLSVLGHVLAQPASHGSLQLGGDRIDYCYQPPSPADWQAQVAHGLVFGLDYLELSSTSARVTVMAVEMVGPSGGLTLDSVAFVPGAEVAGGTDGEKPISTSDPILATLARRLPASLTSTPKPSGVTQTYDPRGWQLAVTVRAPAQAAKASADGFKITYRSGDVTRTLRTPDTVTIGTGKDICKH
jgi:hypothetical protein